MEIEGYVSRKCNRCDGTGVRFDVTCMDNASGSVSPDGKVKCGCLGGRIYTSQASLELAWAADAEREARLASIRAEGLSDMPAWML